MLKSELIKENERLRMELSMVCNRPNDFQSVIIIKREQQKDRLERAIWFGDFPKLEKEKQKEHIIDIIKADEDDGLYKMSEEEIRDWHMIQSLKEKYGE
jgi:hypothetical protein